MGRLARLTAALLLLTAGCAAGNGSPGEEAGSAEAELSAAEMLVLRSTAFHDPQARWGREPVTIEWRGSGDDGAERLALTTVFDPGARTFTMQGNYRGAQIDYAARGSEVTATIDGDGEPDEETRARYALDRENGLMWRNYFDFLAGLPMKLREPGTHLDPEPEATTFDGREVLSVRLTFDPDKGEDVWYFYFEPDSAQLVGCRFYHDEQAGDGEYILMEGLAEGDGLRLPERRRWFVNLDDRFLGEDLIRIIPAG